MPSILIPVYRPSEEDFFQKDFSKDFLRSLDLVFVGLAYDQNFPAITYVRQNPLEGFIHIPKISTYLWEPHLDMLEKNMSCILNVRQGTDRLDEKTNALIRSWRVLSTDSDDSTSDKKSSLTFNFVNDSYINHIYGSKIKHF